MIFLDANLREILEFRLRKGYEQDKEQNLLKTKYIDKLNEACQIIDVILAGCIACRDEGSDIIEAIQAAYDESV